MRQLQTLVFLTLVFTGQGNVYLVRERDHFWHSRPSRWLILASITDVIVASLMATAGILMVAIPWSLVILLLVLVVVFLAATDGLKVRVFRYFGIR